MLDSGEISTCIRYRSGLTLIGPSLPVNPCHKSNSYHILMKKWKKLAINKIYAKVANETFLIKPVIHKYIRTTNQ